MAGAFRQRSRSGEARLRHARLQGAGGEGSERLGRLPLLPEMRTAMRTDRVILTIGLVAITLLARRAWGQEPYALWGDPQKGRQVYAEHGCATCHAINGVGGGLGPDLGRPPGRPTAAPQTAGGVG